MSKLFMSLVLATITNIFAWFQLNGQFLKNAPAWVSSKIFVLLMGAPLGLAFWYATKLSYEHFGFTWNFRLIGFGIGTMIFGGMAWLFLEEIPTLKTIICLLLALSIILIQVTNVIK
jgi:hypothetical protein